MKNRYPTFYHTMLSNGRTFNGIEFNTIDVYKEKFVVFTTDNQIVQIDKIDGAIIYQISDKQLIYTTNYKTFKDANNFYVIAWR